MMILDLLLKYAGLVNYLIIPAFIWIMKVEKTLIRLITDLKYCPHLKKDGD